MPNRSVEVTLVSSLAGALTAVRAALNAHRPFEIAVIDRESSGIRNAAVVRALWTLAPMLSVVDCDSNTALSGDNLVSDVSSQPSVAVHHGLRFRLPRFIGDDQLVQLIDTLLDRLTLKQKCQVMESDLRQMDQRLDDLEEQNQSLGDQVSRLRLKAKEQNRNMLSSAATKQLNVENRIIERRCNGPAVRRVTVACETQKPSELKSESLSRRPDQTHDMPAHDASDESRLNGRVLIVDEVPGNRRLAAFLLEHAGATVVQAHGGRAMLDLFNASFDAGLQFDSVVLHMAMQDIDGYECARQIRKHGYIGPIIAAIACGLPLDRHLCINAGCDEFVTMPLDRNQFIRTVRRMLTSTPATM